MPKLRLFGATAIGWTAVIAVVVILVACADQNTLLSEACRRGDLAKARRVLAEGADVNAKGEDGATPLMIASSKGHSNVVKLLLERGADVNAARNDDLTGTRAGCVES